MPRAIRIKDDAELSTFIDSVATDIVAAHDHYRLFRRLTDAIQEFSREMNQSSTFWSLTIEAHRECALVHLGRIFDQTKGTLSLPNLLMTIQANLRLFDEPHFRARMGDNPFVDGLASENRVPDAKELSKYIQQLGDNDKKLVEPAVRELVILRNKKVGHRASEVVLPLQSFKSATFGNLSWNDVERLLALAEKLINHYCSLFRANTFSISTIGRDDYTQVLKGVRNGLDGRGLPEST